MREMRKEFSLSKINSFMLFNIIKIGFLGYLILIIGFAVVVFGEGISRNSINRFLANLIMITAIIGLPYLLLKFVIAWKNPPYKLAIDLEKRCIDFTLSQTKEVRSIPFDEIDNILDWGINPDFALGLNF